MTVLFISRRDASVAEKEENGAGKFYVFKSIRQSSFFNPFLPASLRLRKIKNKPLRDQ